MADCFSLPNAEELVEELKQCADCAGDYCTEACGKTLFKIADFVEVLLAENAKLKAEMDAAPQWISVKERLPEKDEEYYRRNDCWPEYIVMIAECIVPATLEWDGESWRDDYDCYNVTHWMPLPDQPKEEEE